MISHSTHPRLILSSFSFPLLAYGNILSQVTLIKTTMELLNTFSFMVCHMQAPWFTHLKQISYLPYSRAVALEKNIISHLHFYPSLSTELLFFFYIKILYFLQLPQMIKILCVNFFPFAHRSYFLLSMPSDFCLNAKYCEFYDVEY